MLNIINKIKEQIKEKQIHRYRKQTDIYQRGWELGDWVKKVKELSKEKKLRHRQHYGY